ncbi:CPBP family intramembrane metalloprotease (plasmid) [Halorubrum ezzemoulense]|uniref:CPBP family intramembrane metalloprotease n=1 Tax=Halorubrum ezzemoulense TaxID=337243 RepID=A0A256J168_HALEZ|nr:type II CAAX endopeptidase family protein [Halorubrum ezzemoulense]OYR62535.1 CPBP family intramembrane metalloprotease [Halorubrum ezzemoulense]QAY21860.1 CPBP family intramembrane metalloprotease [Halorubrum ezzemoulense]
METQSDVSRPDIGVREVSRSVGGAAALTALGVMAAFASIVVIDPLFGTVEAEWTLLGELLNNYIVQPGFGLVAACYIWWRDDYNPLERIQVPSFEGVAWIGLGVIGYELAVRAVTPILPLIGLSHSAHGDTTAKWRVFFDHPEIIVPGLVVMFVIMAPMEEALYRGVVHDVLEPALGSLGRVLVGGFLFGGMHLFLSGGLGSLLLTSIFGVLLAAGYERTNNLVVPIMAHAGYWLIFTSF